MDHSKHVALITPKRGRGRPRKTEQEKAAVRKAKFETYRLSGYFKVGGKYNDRPLKGKRKDDVYLDPYHTYFREYMREYRKKNVG